MNVDALRRKLEAMGVDMDRVCIVPAKSKVPGWKRDSKRNLIETADGFLVAGYERGQVFGAALFEDLDSACENLARTFQGPAERREAIHERQRRRIG